MDRSALSTKGGPFAILLICDILIVSSIGLNSIILFIQYLLKYILTNCGGEWILALYYTFITVVMKLRLKYITLTQF